MLYFGGLVETHFMLRNPRKIDMKNEMANLIAHIKADYLTWSRSCARSAVDGSGDRPDIFTVKHKIHVLVAIKKMVVAFDEGISYKVNTKYIKITLEHGGIWGFVVNSDNDKKFRKGDILKAAGWATPARNFARGNILDGGYDARWTGA